MGLCSQMPGQKQILQAAVFSFCKCSYSLFIRHEPNPFYDQGYLPAKFQYALLQGLALLCACTHGITDHSLLFFYKLLSVLYCLIG